MKTQTAKIQTWSCEGCGHCISDKKAQKIGFECSECGGEMNQDESHEMHQSKEINSSSYITKY